MLDLLAFKATDVPAENSLGNSDFSQGSSEWRSLLLESVEIVDGVLEIRSSETSSAGRIDQEMDSLRRDIMYAGAFMKSESGELAVGQSTSRIARHSGSGEYEWVSGNSTTGSSFYYSVILGEPDQIAYVQNAICINLTKTFGQGNEPTSEQMDLLLEQFPNYWFEGMKNLFSAEQFMKLYFKEMKEIRNAITSLGGGS